MANNSLIVESVPLSLEEPLDRTELLREKEALLVRILEAIKEVESTSGWSTLKSLVLSKRIEALEKQLTAESEKEVIDTSKLYKLQGRLLEARKYDLDKLAESFRLELSNIKKLTQPTER